MQVVLVPLDVPHPRQPSQGGPRLARGRHPVQQHHVALLCVGARAQGEHQVLHVRRVATDENVPAQPRQRVALYALPTHRNKVSQ